MTVRELIEELGKMPPNHRVVTDYHSEYSDVETVELIVGYNNGGYVSRPYSNEDKLKSHGFVRVST